MSGLRYLLPLISFALGVWVAEDPGKYRYARKLHWRQGVLLAEIVLLFIVGFVPRELDMLATILVSLPVPCRQSSERCTVILRQYDVYRKPEGRHGLHVPSLLPRA